MTSIEINDRLVLELPDNYQKIPLPGLNKWVTALRGGKYKQGIGLLRSSFRPEGEESFCCLGVLCQLQGRPKTDLAGKTAYDNDTITLSSLNPAFAALGVTGIFPDGVVCFQPGRNQSGDLAALNDRGATFGDIAAVIEHVWKDADEASAKEA